MQYYILVSGIVLVSMLVPVAGVDVQLNVAHKDGVADPHFGFQKIRPGIGIEPSRVDYSNRLSVIGNEVAGPI
jgi:hypothetical protein